MFGAGKVLNFQVDSSCFRTQVDIFPRQWGHRVRNEQIPLKSSLLVRTAYDQDLPGTGNPRRIGQSKVTFFRVKNVISSMRMIRDGVDDTELSKKSTKKNNFFKKFSQKECLKKAPKSARNGLLGKCVSHSMFRITARCSHHQPKRLKLRRQPPAAS